MPSPAVYPILEILPEWVLEPEALGSKEKFWYRRPDGESAWLFKYPQSRTGQHWSEKISAEIAARMGILHARVELAIFQDTRGSVAETFARGGRSLFHGNQILAGKVLGYNPQQRFGQSDHTLANIFLALEQTFTSRASLRRAKAMFVEYLVLDAVIGNTDRHHENWGILRKRTRSRWTVMLAPTFDHASSLGRELRDEARGKCRQRLLRDNQVGAYAEKATGAIHWNKTDKRGLSPLELVRRAASLHPAFFNPALARLERLDRQGVESVVNRVPEDWMTPTARKFAIELMCYTVGQLRGVSP